MSARISPAQPQGIATVLGQATPGLAASKIYQNTATSERVLTHPALPIAYESRAPNNSLFKAFAIHPRLSLQPIGTPSEGAVTLVGIDRHTLSTTLIDGAYTLLDINSAAPTLISADIDRDTKLETRVKILEVLSGLLRSTPEMAISAIGETQDPELFPWIEPFLTSPNLQLRYKALDAIARMKHPQAFDRWVSALSDSDIEKSWVINGLADLGGPRVIPILINMLSDPLPPIIERSLKALRKIQHSSAPETYDTILDLSINHSDKFVRAEAIKTLGTLSHPDVFNKLIELLTSPDTRGSSIRALGYLRDDRAIPLLISLLSNWASLEKHEIYTITTALGKIGGAGAKGTLLKLYDELRGDTELHEATILGLGYLKDVSLAPLFIEALTTDSHTKIRIAAEALGKMTGLDLSHDLSIALKNEKDPHKKYYILNCLAIQGNPDSFKLFQEILEGTDEVVGYRRCAANNLGTLYYQLKPSES
jgi:hypothetical protein